METFLPRRCNPPGRKRILRQMPDRIDDVFKRPKAHGSRVAGKRQVIGLKRLPPLWPGGYGQREKVIAIAAQFAAPPAAGVVTQSVHGWALALHKPLLYLAPPSIGCRFP